MPLYDNDNPLGDEAPTLVALGDLLSESTGAQSLLGATGTSGEKEAAVIEHTIIGPHLGCWDRDKFTIDEWAERFCEFQIMAPTEGGKTVVVNALEVDAAGQFILATRRYCRPAELVDRKDTYLFFLDCVSKLENELASWFATRACPRLNTVQRVQLGFNSRKSGTAQGEYLFATHTIDWGDSFGSDNL